MPAEVLLVEDSPGDVRLTLEAFRDADKSVHMHVVCDGVEAMAFLRHEKPYVNAPRPDLILLDLNLPKMDGREVLSNIKTDDNLKTIPTIVLTTSDSPMDVARTYQLQVNCYLKKPEEWDAFSSLIKDTINFWLTRAKLPRESKAADEVNA
jgi:two-component system, chemotaxis family, response regulator Rcp1